MRQKVVKDTCIFDFMDKLQFHKLSVHLNPFGELSVKIMYV